MTKKELAVFVPSEQVTNVREAVTVEKALNISVDRFDELGGIMLELWENNPTKAEMLLAIANRDDLTDKEKTYMGYKLFERAFTLKNPLIWSFFGGTI